MILFQKQITSPLLFIHGFLGTPSDWEGVCSRLAMFECIKINLPGHGNTPFTPHFHEWMPEYPKMHLIGYSMGGRLAMQYADLFPERIASLTIISSHVGLQEKNEKQKRLEIDIEWAKKIHHSFDDFLIKWYDQPIFAGFRPDLTMRKKQNPIELAKTLIHYSLGKQEFLQPKNAQFIVGMRDQKYKDLYPNAIVIPDAGHMVHLEQPITLAKIIEQRVLL